MISAAKVDNTYFSIFYYTCFFRCVKHISKLISGENVKKNFF